MRKMMGIYRPYIVYFVIEAFIAVAVLQLPMAGPSAPQPRGAQRIDQAPQAPDARTLAQGLGRLLLRAVELPLDLLCTPAAAEEEDDEEPNCGVDSPNDQDTVQGTIDVSATASDNEALDEVRLSIGWSCVEIRTEPTNPCTINYSWNTREGPDTDVNINVWAIDTSSNENEDEITVYVDNCGKYPPTDVELGDPTNITETSVNLSWSPQNNDHYFQSYRIYVDTEPNVNVLDWCAQEITNHTTLSTTITGLTGDTKYYFKVYVFDTCGGYYEGNEKDATTTGDVAPQAVYLNAPTDISSSSMKLEWTKSIAVDFASYKIYRDTQPGVDTNDTLVTTIDNQNTTSYTVEQLSADTTYYFKVYVFDTEPLSTGSNEVSASTTDGNAPSAVTLSDPSGIGSSWLTLSWTKSTDDEFAAYKIYRDTSAGVDTNDTLVVKITDVNVTEYQVSGLSQSTQYYFKVYVFDVESLSAGSNEKNATTTSDASPAAVTLNTPTDVRGNRLTLSWSANSDPDFKEYKIYRDTSAGVDENDTLVATIAGQGSTVYVNRNISDNTTHYYKVYVYDTADNGTASNEVNATTPQNVGPTNVSITSPSPSASVGGRHVPVTVTASDETQIYKLELKVDGDVATDHDFADNSPKSLEWTFDWCATWYSGNVTLTVVAYDDDPEEGEEGEDYNSTTSSGVTVNVSNPNPTVSIVTPLTGDTVAGAAVPVVVDCGPTSPSTSGIKKLELFIDSEGTAHAVKDFGWRYATPGGRYTLSWDSTQYSNASHTIKVKATDDMNDTTTSATQTVTVDNANNVPPNRVLLDDPTNVADTTLNLHWSLNEDTDFSKYEVHKSTTQSFTPDANSLEATITTQSSNFYHVEDLSGSTTYYFKIKVYDNAGTPLSVISNEVNAATRSTGNDLSETTVISYTYDNVGRKATMSDPFGTTLYTYNARGELTQVKDPNAKTVAYQYNDGRLRTQMTDQFSGVTTYTYDNANRLTKVTDPDSNETDYTYDKNGRRTQMDLPNGTYTLYTYNSRNWLTAITHKKSDTSTFLSISYEQDKLGNPTKATENNGDVTDYTYDDLYRLTRETKEDSGEQTLYDYSYTYDAVGNRTKKRDEVAQQDSNYTNNSMNQMTAAGNITYTYDDAGNMATKVVNQDTTTYTWDFRNKMLKVDFPTGDDPVMRYDGYGTRVQKVVGSTTTKYLYDIAAAVPAVLFETDASDSEVAEYRRDAWGDLIAMERSSTLYWCHFDHLGSTRALTNSSQTATDTYAYDAWGNVTASSGSTVNVLKFVGEYGYYSDGDVGLSLLGARYYDAGCGRFVSADPSREGVNWYGYARGNPMKYIDPTGRWCWVVAVVAIVICGVVVGYIIYIKCRPPAPPPLVPGWPYDPPNGGWGQPCLAFAANPGPVTCGACCDELFGAVNTPIHNECIQWCMDNYPQ